mmetsp:Transcript_36800/g.92235  ORF Transcript_36800/g.92235 Transcript_36800/m.92235 type:complete len:283 (-) Transcript_36800:31-879(-)|eukprot:CAMPEP_0177654446 /NCGR_PEP_ID=MMETSP0447-20121125/14338_1 /TAXON_ID=0 /ORGANISM="Stygamoeba regulata, Strain BSH-02190019" /LENGTH=282 /DNA_ID=CAMNT_0019158099 /DNA_START=50 /DNA_END=898 /DNA_ORIENTATION=+
MSAPSTPRGTHVPTSGGAPSVAAVEIDKALAQWMGEASGQKSGKRHSTPRGGTSSPSPRKSKDRSSVRQRLARKQSKNKESASLGPLAHASTDLSASGRRCSLGSLPMTSPSRAERHGRRMISSTMTPQKPSSDYEHFQPPICKPPSTLISTCYKPQSRQNMSTALPPFAFTDKLVLHPSIGALPGALNTLSTASSSISSSSSSPSNASPHRSKSSSSSKSRRQGRKGTGSSSSPLRDDSSHCTTDETRTEKSDSSPGVTSQGETEPKKRSKRSKSSKTPHP